MPDSASSTAASSNQHPRHRSAGKARARADRCLDRLRGDVRAGHIATKWCEIALRLIRHAFSLPLEEQELAAATQLMSGGDIGQIPQQDHSTRIAIKWYYYSLRLAPAAILPASIPDDVMALLNAGIAEMPQQELMALLNAGIADDGEGHTDDGDSDATSNGSGFTSLGCPCVDCVRGDPPRQVDEQTASWDDVYVMGLHRRHRQKAAASLLQRRRQQQQQQQQQQ